MHQLYEEHLLQNAVIQHQNLPENENMFYHAHKLAETTGMDLQEAM